MLQQKEKEKILLTNSSHASNYELYVFFYCTQVRDCRGSTAVRITQDSFLALLNLRIYKHSVSSNSRLHACFEGINRFAIYVLIVQSNQDNLHAC